ELGRLVHRFVETETIEGPGLATQTPAQLGGVRCTLGRLLGIQRGGLYSQEAGSSGQYARGLEKGPAVHGVLLRWIRSVTNERSSRLRWYGVLYGLDRVPGEAAQLPVGVFCHRSQRGKGSARAGSQASEGVHGTRA